jgi:hypothetical protein
VFLKGWLADAAQDIVCRGLGAREPDSPRKSMARGGEEQARAEKIGFELPCTTFGNTIGLRNHVCVTRCRKWSLELVGFVSFRRSKPRNLQMFRGKRLHEIYIL